MTGDALSDERHMLRALALARRGQGWVEPNPMVGCVLVREGRVIGEGFHRRFGGPHAEVEALADCRRRGMDPAGATALVTLEPCCHTGKTPPCTDALIRARVAKVVAAMVDPFPQVAGRGLAVLREAGLAVEVGLCQEQARAVNEPFVKRVGAGLPWVILKWAQTLDGRIAAASGDSKWISSPRSRQEVHRLRARVDAVVVGIGTALADDPLLTARGVARRRVARRVVVDPSLRLNPDSQLVRSLGEPPRAPLLVAVAQDVLQAPPAKLTQLQAQGVEFLGLPPLPEDPSKLDLRLLLTHLAATHAATNVLVEGGATLAGAMLAQGLVDQVLAFVAPKLLGDAAAIPAVRGLACPRIEAARLLTLRALRRVGDDVLLDYRVTKK